MPIAILTVIFSSALYSIYSVYFHYKFGATLGKMTAGIKVTMPNGTPIGLKQALLRSSVDIGFAAIATAGYIIALSRVDPEQYLATSFMERIEYIKPFYSSWYNVVDISADVWLWSELFVLLLNKRKRAIHDFIAGTVVIENIYAK